MKNQILFYKVNENYGEFSNFYKISVIVDSKRYKTTEHYYQCQKMVTSQDFDEIFHAKLPSIAARLGRQRHRLIRTNWEEIKDSVMLKCVYEKFIQHEHLKNLLLSTENSEIIEYSLSDTYWGSGSNFQGKNMLGKILMMVRHHLQSGTKLNFEMVHENNY